MQGGIGQGSYSLIYCIRLMLRRMAPGRGWASLSSNSVYVFPPPLSPSPLRPSTR